MNESIKYQEIYFNNQNTKIYGNSNLSEHFSQGS